MSLKDKVVIVTGSSSGIGAAIATTFAAQGAKVVIVGRNEIKLKNVSEICENSGSKPLAIVADVTKDSDLKKIVTETTRHFGRIDVLINNAGAAGTANITATDALEVFDRTIATNLRSAVTLTHLAVPQLIETKGNIINISSIAAMNPLVTNSFPYSTSKAALDHFSRCVALELAPKGVRVNTINPGPVKTDIIENSGADKIEEEIAWGMMKNATALDRISDPNEVADLALFLASDKARSITGSSFVTDNGALLKGFWGV